MLTHEPSSAQISFIHAGRLRRIGSIWKRASREYLHEDAAGRQQLRLQKKKARRQTTPG
tara:strand:- start:58 stop:234 length:177 start_codon:yes stop_codon:yes gene_type:complete